MGGMKELNMETTVKSSIKQKVMRPVAILAPDDQLILHATERVGVETLPLFPGSAALESVISEIHQITIQE